MRKMNWRIWKNIKLPRGKFLKRLDWYIIKKFLGTYVFAIALIISIAVVFDFNEKMDRFMSHEAPWNAIVFDYYLKGTKEPRWMKEGIHLRERGIDQKYDLLKK